MTRAWKGKWEERRKESVLQRTSGKTSFEELNTELYFFLLGELSRPQA